MNAPNSFSVLPPVCKTRFLAFDVETTGLLPKEHYKRTGIKHVPIEKYPHIIQLSFALYETDNKKITLSKDAYINIDQSIPITDEITKLTGATRDKCNGGISITDAIIAFSEAYHYCDGIVAHNMEFDETLILIELERNRKYFEKHAPQCFAIFHKIFENTHGMERYCTMRKGTDICNILVPSNMPNGVPKKKWPKLIELYKTLFPNEPINGLHNSMIDVVACLRCYLKMRHNLYVDFAELMQQLDQ
jgi:DNA polymerase-3 subunit epsilon|tara:strand:- start:116 stop:856 length:741 start_codon:yes stop_codon:yes gene_type:complete